MKTFITFFSEDGEAPTTTTAGVSGAGDNPSKTVPVSKAIQKKLTSNNSTQTTLRHRQSSVNMIRAPGMNEAVCVGDKGHIGYAIKGGLGFLGTVSKVEKDMLHVKAKTNGVWGPREFKGHPSKFTKDK
jgi:hypothetical protein